LIFSVKNHVLKPPQHGLDINIRNKRAQRALGRSPEEKVTGNSRANNREPQGHNLSNFGRGPFDDQSAS